MTPVNTPITAPLRFSYLGHRCQRHPGRLCRLLAGYHYTLPTTIRQTGAGNISLSSTSSSTARKAYDIKTVGSSGLQFDGSNDYVTVQPPSGSITHLTVEFWVKPTALGCCQNYKVITGTMATAFEVGLSGNSGNVGPWMLVGTSDIRPTGSSSMVVGQWYHVAISFTSTTAKIFLNGQKIASVSSFNSGAIPSLYDSTHPFIIGGSSGGLTGYIDEARISNTVRYTGNFTPPRRFVTDANTVALYHFDDGTGTSATDSSGNANTGTLMNGASNSPAADGTTNGPIWSDGIAADSSGNSSLNWALPGYSSRKQLTITNNVASVLGAGYGVETTEDRGSKLDNKQTLPSGNDWRVEYQPPNPKTSLSFDGSAQYVEYPNDIVTGSALTVEAWVDPVESKQQDILSQGGTGTNGTSILLELNTSGQVRFRWETIPVPRRSAT